MYGSVNAKTLDVCSGDVAQKIKAVRSKGPIVFFLGSARTHGDPGLTTMTPQGSRRTRIPHLITFPYSPQLGVAEMMLSRLKNHAASELVQHPERRKGLGKTADEITAQATEESIGNCYYV